MFDRKSVRQTAINKLRGCYLRSVGAVAIYFLITYILVLFMPKMKYIGYNIAEIERIIETNLLMYYKAFGIFLSSTILVQTFLLNPLALGVQKYFMDNSKGERDYKTIFFAFRENYIEIVKIKFVQGLLISLWSLLLFIPGIIKKYQYYMVDYILIEEPSLGLNNIFLKSKEMTYGIKSDIFVFDIYFILMIVAMLMISNGVGNVFVYPYYFASKAELYYTIKLNRYGISGDYIIG